MRDKIGNYVSSWKRKGYPKDIPDEAPVSLEALNKAPSYRQICRAIIRNDFALTTLGFQRPLTPEYMALKRIEIENRERKRSSKK